MARYYRRYRRYRPRRYIRRWFKRRTRRFINGSSKSSIRVKIPMTFTDSRTQDANTVGTTVTVLSCPFYTSQLNCSPLRSELYRTYCHLYDEVKCIGAKVILNVSSQVGGTDIPSLQIYTGWDRRFSNSDNIPTFADLSTYSTYQTATAVNNSVCKLQRTCYASDLLEKAQWHDCTLAQDANAKWYDKAFVQAADNPNFFCPTCFLAFAIPSKTTATTVTYTVDIVYYFSFRNPKFGATSSAAKAAVDTRSVLPSALPDGDAPAAVDSSVASTLELTDDLPTLLDTEAEVAPLLDMAATSSALPPRQAPQSVTRVDSVENTRAARAAAINARRADQRAAEAVARRAPQKNV